MDLIGYREKVKEVKIMKKFTIAWFQAHPEYVREQNAIYDSKRPTHWKRKGDKDYWKAKALAHKIRCQKLNRMPLWANEEAINEVFRTCSGDDFHIDHVIPLQGELVSGLHVENNLQKLTVKENCQKSNKFKPRRSIIFRGSISLF
jgi:hypothetical protein